MNIGFITFHRVQNSGAILQAYALQTVIKQMGHDATFIDYHPSMFSRYDSIFRRGFQPKTLLRNLYTLTKYKTIRCMYGRFDSFIEQHLCLTDKQYVTSSELQDTPPIFDAYICGSDQIWNPQMDTEMGKPYFLGFAPAGTCRIAYAPSFGVSEIPADRKETIAHHINAFDFLSVREKQGQTIIKQLTDRDATLVLDPTLLLSAESWQTVANPTPIEEPYILIYAVMTGSIAELVAEVKRKTGMKTVAIYSGLSSIPIPNVDYVLRDIGPTEFIGLFQNAAATVVNTFHGTVFSIIHRKPFLVTSGQKPSRIISLLDILDLSSHWISDVNSVPPNELIDRIDSNITGIAFNLEPYQQKSLSFLKNALKS